MLRFVSKEFLSPCNVENTDHTKLLKQDFQGQEIVIGGDSIRSRVIQLLVFL
jgi:hypothetical protein